MTTGTAPAADPPGNAWYLPGTSDLEQGDILVSVALVAQQPSDNGAPAFSSRQGRAVVLTQSCDILKKAQKHLLLAEVHEYDTIAKPKDSHLRDPRYMEGLARGTAISEFLLPPHPDGSFGWMIISFRDLVVMPKVTLQSHAGASSVIRLASPYREYLSQTFARFMMRVGLDATLEEFTTHTPPGG